MRRWLFFRVLKRGGLFVSWNIHVKYLMAYKCQKTLSKRSARAMTYTWSSQTSCTEAISFSHLHYTLLFQFLELLNTSHICKSSAETCTYHFTNQQGLVLICRRRCFSVFCTRSLLFSVAETAFIELELDRESHLTNLVFLYRKSYK